MDDPLLYYGAVDGLLPGKTAAQSNLLRLVVIRYEERHCNFEWENISSLIATLYRVESSEVKIFATTDPNDGRESYCLELTKLALVAHAVVAVQQILDVLQLRLDRANTHIRANLSGIRETLTGQAFTETLDSVVSTVSEVRERYGSGTPSQQLYRMLARHDYGRRAQIIDRTAYHQLVESIQKAEVIDPRPYKSRRRSRARSDSPEMDSVVEETVQEEAPASAAPAANASYFGPIPSALYRVRAISEIRGVFLLKAQFLGGHQ
ncbi:hypothetical protein C8R46DRAFT_1024562 [Mycena filopes]|nr:hypothetical protein C8R46DRAFT_1024562 [Mycena filopes]